jgi:hypothetical protein
VVARRIHTFVHIQAVQNDGHAVRNVVVTRVSDDDVAGLERRSSKSWKACAARLGLLGNVEGCALNVVLDLLVRRRSADWPAPFHTG